MPTTIASSIGFIGTGAMGGAVARRLLARGRRLLVLAGPRGTNTGALAEAGATLAGAPTDLAGCDVVFSCLPSSDVVERVAADVLLPAARPGFVHVDLTTGDPRVSLQLGERYDARGARFVDAAVSGTPEHAEQGELTLLLGASAQVEETLRPLLEDVARRILRVGATGSAHRLRLIMGFIGMATAAASAEALVAARRAGIDLATFAELLGETGMTSSTFQAMAAAAIDGDEARRRLSLANAAENTRCLADLMRDLGVAAPVADATAATFGEVVGQGHGEAFVPALTRLKLGQVG
jgi:3-hydroxyisobutyrate dehydrogenase-like beta-hydroxyacid dehydrogenase